MLPLGHLRGRPARGPAGFPQLLQLWLLVSLVSLVTQVQPAAAHEFWLWPSSYHAPGGREIQIAAATGEGFGGQPMPFARERTVSLELLAARRLDLTVVAGEGDSVFARFIAPDDSGAVVTYVSEPAAITLPAAKFEAYLADDGLDQVLAARAAAGQSTLPGRERFRRCAKTWVAGTGRAGANASALRLLSPAGLPAEIVALTDPLAADTLRVQLCAGGRPVPGALVHAWRRPLAERSASAWRPESCRGRAEVEPAAALRTDARGEVAIPLMGGEWIVSAVVMVPSTAPECDWESTWASLTFARP